MTSSASSHVWPLQVSGLEILGPIGSGGMGEVYLARQAALERFVAVKWMRSESALGMDPCAIDRFRREAALMARANHPNVLTIHDFGTCQGRPYLVMEYVEAGDLRRRMSASTPMNPEDVGTLMAPVCDAISCLHRNSILHRDLKPENILLVGGATPKVADFGIAVLRDGIGLLTGTSEGLGTAGYVAPEQLYNLGVDERVDQYSLAAMVYEMLTGQRPLGMFKPPSQHNAQVSEATDRVILKALSESPKERFASVDEFAAALLASLASPRPATATTSTTTEKPKRRRPWLRRIAVGLGLLLALVIISGDPDDKTQDAPRDGVVLAPPAEGEADESPAPADVEPITEDSLVDLQAYIYWIEGGRLIGPEGKQAAKANRIRARPAVQQQLSKLAYGVWVDRGSPRDSDPEAERADWHEAHRLLKAQLEQRIRELEETTPDIEAEAEEGDAVPAPGSTESDAP